MNVNIQNTRGAIRLTSRGRGARGNFQRGRYKNVVVSVQTGKVQASPQVTTKRRGANSTSTSSSKFETTSSVHNSSTMSSDESRVIIALSEGRGEASCEVGIAAIDLTRPSLIVCQIGDGHSYINTLRKINVLNPTEIILPLTFIDANSPNRLLEKLKQQFRDVKITAVGRNTYNAQSGMDYIKNLCAKAYNSIIFVLQHRHYALTATAGLLHYIENSLFIFYTHNSIKIEHQETEGLTMIDVSTADQLELVSSNHPTANPRFSSLFGIMNKCITKIGTRSLRSTILQPPCRLQDIQERLSCIAELNSSPDTIPSIKSILSKTPNIDQLLSLATIIPDDPDRCKERQLNYLLLLNSTLQLLQPLSEVFERSKEPFFIQLRKTLKSESFKTIQDLLHSIIHQDAHPAKGQNGIIQRCFCIKAGIHGMLDLSRKSYSERVDELREYIKTLASKYNMDLSLANNNKKGYHIVLKLNSTQRRSLKKSDLPDEFIQFDRLSSIVTMKTMELLNYSSRIDDLTSEILKMSNNIVHQLLLTLKENVGLFYTLCEQIAKLDMLQSLALTSTNPYYNKPKFSNYMELLHAKHPLLDFLCHRESVANSIMVSEDHNLHIITGPNGSGKSVFIRQIFLLQVMAQVGCYVPAFSATFRIADRLLARVDLGDNMQLGASAFVLEMKELKYFMNVMTDNTLIIMDELCRSTSLEEGTAIAMAICEQLMRAKAFIFVTTHYVPLAKLSEMYYNVKAWQLHSLEKKKPNGATYLEFTHHVVPGIVMLENYALHLARACWHEVVMSYVDRIMEKLSTRKKMIAKFEAVSAKSQLKYDLEVEYKILKSKGHLSVQMIMEKILEYQQNLKSLGIELDLSDILQNNNVTVSDNLDESISRVPTTSYTSTEQFNNATGKAFESSNSQRNIEENSSVAVHYLRDCSQYLEGKSCNNITEDVYVEPEAVYSQYTVSGSHDSFKFSVLPGNLSEGMNNPHNLFPGPESNFQFPKLSNTTQHRSGQANLFSNPLHTTFETQRTYLKHLEDKPEDDNFMPMSGMSYMYQNTADTPFQPQSFAQNMYGTSLEYARSDCALAEYVPQSVPMDCTPAYFQDQPEESNQVGEGLTRDEPVFKMPQANWNSRASATKTSLDCSLLSVGEKQFSLPLFLNMGKTSTPLKDQFPATPLRKKMVLKPQISNQDTSTFGRRDIRIKDVAEHVPTMQPTIFEEREQDILDVSAITVNEKQFSMPLLLNQAKTSTPLHGRRVFSEPLLNTPAIQNSIALPNKLLSPPKLIDDKLSSSQNVISKSNQQNQNNLKNGNEPQYMYKNVHERKEEQKRQDEPNPIIRNPETDDEVSQAIEELQSVSESFTVEWDHMDEDMMSDLNTQNNTELTVQTQEVCLAEETGRKYTVQVRSHKESSREAISEKHGTQSKNEAIQGLRPEGTDSECSQTQLHRSRRELQNSGSTENFVKNASSKETLQNLVPLDIKKSCQNLEDHTGIQSSRSSEHPQNVSQENSITYSPKSDQECDQPENYNPTSIKMKSVEEIGRQHIEQNDIIKSKMETQKLTMNKTETHKLTRYQSEPQKLTMNKTETHKLTRNKSEPQKLTIDKIETQKFTMNKIETHKLTMNKSETQKLTISKIETQKLTMNKTENQKLTMNKTETQMQSSIFDKHTEKLTEAETSNKKTQQSGVPAQSLGTSYLAFKEDEASTSNAEIFDTSSNLIENTTYNHQDASNLIEKEVNSNLNASTESESNKSRLNNQITSSNVSKHLQAKNSTSKSFTTNGSEELELKQKYNINQLIKSLKEGSSLSKSSLKPSETSTEETKHKNSKLDESFALEDIETKIDNNVEAWATFSRYESLNYTKNKPNLATNRERRDAFYKNKVVLSEDMFSSQSTEFGKETARIEEPQSNRIFLPRFNDSSASLNLSSIEFCKDSTGKNMKIDRGIEEKHKEDGYEKSDKMVYKEIEEKFEESHKKSKDVCEKSRETHKKTASDTGHLRKHVVGPRQQQKASETDDKFKVLGARPKEIREKSKEILEKCKENRDKTKENRDKTKENLAEPKENFGTTGDNTGKLTKKVLRKASDTTRKNPDWMANEENLGKSKRMKMQVGPTIFVAPKMLTRKQIRECYDEQTAQLMNAPEEQLERNFNIIKNRPSVKHLQQAEHVAVIRKTKEGIVCHNIEERTISKRTKFLPPLKGTVEPFNVSIFSDKNVGKFEELMQSSSEKKSVSDWTLEPITSGIICRKPSGNFSATSRIAEEKKDMKSQVLNKSLTPDGFFKRNKPLMTRILQKYNNNSDDSR